MSMVLTSLPGVVENKTEPSVFFLLFPHCSQYKETLGSMKLMKIKKKHIFLGVGGLFDTETTDVFTCQHVFQFEHETLFFQLTHMNRPCIFVWFIISDCGY